MYANFKAVLSSMSDIIVNTWKIIAFSVDIRRAET